MLLARQGETWGDYSRMFREFKNAEGGSLNLQEAENFDIPQQFGDREAWEAWLAGHFENGEPKSAQEVTTEFFTTRSLDNSAVNLQTSPFEGISQEEWRQWMIERFDEAEQADVQIAIQTILDR